MSKFSSNIDYLRQYVNDELSPTQMYEIERAMHEDEMLMDIIEGLETEKALNIPIASAEIHANIKVRTEKSSGVKTFSIKKLAIAASVIAVLGVGSLYFLNFDNNSNNLVYTGANSTVENTIGNPPNENLKVDSSRIAFSEKEEIEDDNSTIVNKSIKPKISSMETPLSKKIMVYSAKPKMQVVIDGPKYLNKENEEVVLVGYGNSSIAQPENELLSARVGSYQHPKPVTSIAKTQSDLQRLDIDPQTKANLSAVLSRQTQEHRIDVKEKHGENTFSDILMNGNALANKKNSDAKVISSAESLEVITAKPIQNGNPTIGWGKFQEYIKVQLQKKGFTSYTANLSFELDATRKPTHIEIKTSSNPKINAVIIDILKNGPTWENKDPNHPIFIRINSEETTK